jgi:hypothetical protein
LAAILTHPSAKAKAAQRLTRSGYPSSLLTADNPRYSLTGATRRPHPLSHSRAPPRGNEVSLPPARKARSGDEKDPLPSGSNPNSNSNSNSSLGGNGSGNAEARGGRGGKWAFQQAPLNRRRRKRSSNIVVFCDDLGEGYVLYTIGDSESLSF